MKLQQLEALVAVVDQGSIRAAARQLNVSQAAVTKSMRMLEDEAGVPLLLRGSRGVALTDNGRRLVVRARLITRQVSLAREDLQLSSSGDAGSLRVGITPLATLTLLGEAFNWFRQRYRNVHMEFSDALMLNVVPRLREGSLDMAIVAMDAGEAVGDEFRVQRLRRIAQCVVARRGHPARAKPSAAALAGCEWVFTRPMSPERMPLISQPFERVGVPLPSRYVVCEALQAFSLLRHSDAVGFMPTLALLKHPETQGIERLEGSGLQPNDFELVILTREDLPMTPAMEYFSHCITQLSRELTPA